MTQQGSTSGRCSFLPNDFADGMAERPSTRIELTATSMLYSFALDWLLRSRKSHCISTTLTCYGTALSSHKQLIHHRMFINKGDPERPVFA
jgi:hypothetical protein